MSISEHYTNEKILQKRTNQFDLVLDAIRLAENMVRSGRPPRVKLPTENPALLIIAEIEAGKDTLSLEGEDFETTPVVEE